MKPKRAKFALALVDKTQKMMALFGCIENASKVKAL